MPALRPFDEKSTPHPSALPPGESKKSGLSSLTDADNRDGHQPSLMLGHEPTGQWMRTSALENPRFLVVTISNFLGRRIDRHTRKSYVEARPLIVDEAQRVLRRRLELGAR